MPALRWPAALLAAGLLLVLVSTATALILVSQALEAPGAASLPFAIAGIVACYVIVLATVLRQPAVGDALGGAFGVVAGVLWCAEIFGGGPARLGHPVEMVVGATTSLLAAGCELGAGPVAALRHQRLAAIWRSGLYAGMTSGTIVFTFAVVMTLATLDILGGRPDYRAQFADSGAPSMHAYLVQDILGAACAHLVINVLVALIGAGAAATGLVIVRALRPAARGGP